MNNDLKKKFFTIESVDLEKLFITNKLLTKIRQGGKYSFVGTVDH